MPCIHHLPSRTAMLLVSSAVALPGPAPSHSTPARWHRAGAASPGSSTAEPSGTPRPSIAPLLHFSAHTYLPAHASSSFASTRKGHTGHAARGPFDSRRSRPLRRARADSTPHTCQAGASPSKRRRRTNSTGLLNAPSPQSTGQNLPRRANLLRRPPPVSATLDSPIKGVPEPL